MRALVFRTFVLACASWIVCDYAKADHPLPWDEALIVEAFGAFDGALVLLDVERNITYRYNPERCAERLAPCSTFKIPNALIGLETGVLKDADHLYPWDGAVLWNDNWNRDHTLASAFRGSVVWYFQRFAVEIGEERMSGYLRECDYGNQDISSGIDRFWLSGSLLISADEQIEFLRRFHAAELPFSRRSLDIVMDVMVVEETDAYTLRGKTGSGLTDGKVVLGWFVGSVARGEDLYLFAANIGAEDNALGSAAREIVMDLLDSLGLRGVGAS